VFALTGVTVVLDSNQPNFIPSELVPIATHRARLSNTNKVAIIRNIIVCLLLAARTATDRAEPASRG
jgi:hypothetical protein